MSKLNWKLPLTLSILLFTLGTFAYWLEYNHKPKKEIEDEQSKKVFKLKEASFAQVKIEDGTKKFTLLCLSTKDPKLCKPNDHSEWEISEPTKLSADSTNVNSLLSTLQSLTSNETLDLSTETPEKKSALLKEYKLDSENIKTGSSRKVEINTVQGGKLVVYFGAAHPVGENIFTKIEGDDAHVYLIPSYFKSNFEHDLTYWRNKKLFSIESHEIEGFNIQSPKNKIQASRKDGKWTLRSAVDELPGDMDQVNSYLGSITGLSAKNFQNQDQNKVILENAKQALRLVLQFSEKGKTQLPLTLTLYEKKKLEKGSKTPATELLYAAVSNQKILFELDTSSLSKLNKGLKDLRMSKLLTSLERYTINRIELAGTPVDSIVLSQKDSQWSFSTGKKEVDQSKVQKLLDKLVNSKIEEFLESSKIPAGLQNGIQITLGDEKTHVKHQYVFWKLKDKLYAKDLLSKKKEAYELEHSFMDALPWSKDYFNKVPLVTAAPYNVAQKNAVKK